AAVLAALVLATVLLVTRSPIPNGRILHVAVSVHGATAVALAATMGASGRARGMPTAVWVAPFLAAQVHVVAVGYRALANVSSATLSAFPNTRLGIALGILAVSLAVAPVALALARTPLPREEAILRTTRRFLPVGDVKALGIRQDETKER
ncbi:MAG TPA: hypothetical protein VI997_01990, partial [Candidatus Thermoplasmatota archaeon]|nr:hypothetical protein [Candidatus Thermoplasmatota archaeon]